MQKIMHLIFLSAVAIFCFHFQAQADSCYKMVSIDSEDSASFFAYSVNANGQVVGERWCASQSRASLWDPANGMKDLGVLPGAISSTAYGINNIGKVVGGCSTPEESGLFFGIP